MMNVFVWLLLAAAMLQAGCDRAGGECVLAVRSDRPACSNSVAVPRGMPALASACAVTSAPACDSSMPPPAAASAAVEGGVTGSVSRPAPERGPTGAVSRASPGVARGPAWVSFVTPVLPGTNSILPQVYSGSSDLPPASMVFSSTSSLQVLTSVWVEAVQAQSASSAATRASLLVSQKSEVIVLGYHRFVKEVRFPETEVTAAEFASQMLQLANRGITVIPLQDFIAWKRGRKTIPKKCAVITVDDGYKCVYEVAWPILKKAGYPFTIFVYTDYVHGTRTAGRESLTWEQLAEMRDAGVDIQSHAVSHGMLRGRRGRSEDEYDEWLWKELAGSKSVLERRLGLKVNALAVPGGSCDDHVRGVAAKAGYEVVFTVVGEKVTFATPPDDVGRYIIGSGENNHFARACAFGGPACGYGEPVAEIDSGRISASPPEGSTVREPRPSIAANLGSLLPVDPTSVVVRVSGFGIVDAKYDATTRVVSCSMTQDLTGDVYAVIVSARSGGRKVESRWSFRVAGE